MPIISVVMPVYHAEATLARAIESFLASQGDYELVIVFDGEQDACLSIASGYAETNPSLSLVYPKKRLGAAKARELGIKQAKGEYCCFLDADDRLAPHALERFEELSQNGLIDIVNVSFFISSKEKDKKNAFTKKAQEMDNQQAFAALLADSYVRGFLWTKMIRRNLLLGAFSTVGEDALFEDTCVTAYAFAQAKRFVYVPEPLYRYTKSEGETAVSKPRVNRSAYHLAALASIRLFLEKGHPELLPTFFKAKFRSYWSLWYDRTQDKKFGLAKGALTRNKKEFKAIFDAKKALNVIGASYEAMIDPRLL